MAKKVKAYLKTNDGEIVASTVLYGVWGLQDEEVRKKAAEYFEQYGYFIGSKKSVMIEEVH